MSESTYLERIVSLFESAEAVVNRKLDEADLPRLVDWYASKPNPPRQESTPYGWFEVGVWPDDAQRPEIALSQDDPTVRFVVPVVACVAFSTSSGSELQRLAVRYIPRVMAALEGSREGLTVMTVDWRPGPNGSALFRFHQILFVVSGERRLGEIA